MGSVEGRRQRRDIMETTKVDRHIAVVGNGSWGGQGKVHAAVEGSGVPPRNAPGSYSCDLWYTSRCGLPYLYEYGRPASPFESVFRFDQCQRCTRILAKASR